MFRMRIAAAALAATSIEAVAMAAPPVAMTGSASVVSATPARKRVRNGPGWDAPRYRRSRGPQAHRKRRTNRNHISRRTRRKHRRAA